MKNPRINLNRNNHLLTILSIGLMLLFVPLVCVSFVLGKRLGNSLDDVLFAIVFISPVAVATVIMNCIRKLCHLTKRGTFLVLGFYSLSVVALVFWYIMEKQTLAFAVFIAIQFILLVLLIDKKLELFVNKRKSKDAFSHKLKIIQALSLSGIIVFLETVSFLSLVIVAYTNIDLFLHLVFVMLGYSYFWGWVYDTCVKYSPLPVITRVCSFVLLLGVSLFIVLFGEKMVELCVSAILLFWTTVGLLLYDLICLMAGRMGKKLASKKQDSLEEPAEA